MLAGARVRDEWAVLGQIVVEDERLRSQRTWLQGLRSGRTALILAFAPAGQVLDPGVASAPPRRRRSPSTPARRRCGRSWRSVTVSRGRSIGCRVTRRWKRRSALRAQALARNPWTDRFPTALRDVVPARDGAEWALADGDGRALALAPRTLPWELVAVSGGHPVDVFGELDGEQLRPLAVAADGRVVALA